MKSLELSTDVFFPPVFPYSFMSSYIYVYYYGLSKSNWTVTFVDVYSLEIFLIIFLSFVYVDVIDFWFDNMFLLLRLRSMKL